MPSKTRRPSVQREGVWKWTRDGRFRWRDEKYLVRRGKEVMEASVTTAALWSEHNAPYPEIAALRAAMQRLITQYPLGVEEIPPGPPISGNGFFPGANGLYIDGNGAVPPMPVGRIMVLGHNYDVRRKYDEFLAAGEESEREVKTWNVLLTKVFPTAGINPKECFYTNFYMGLMSNFDANGKMVTNTDKFPGAKDALFVAMCRRFFAEQVKIIRPRLVIVLGKYTPCKVTDAFVRSDLWRNRDTFRNIDAGGRAVLRDVEVAGTGVAPTFVVLAHPSYRHINLKHRSYKGLVGDEAETLMLRDAVRFSGIGTVQH